MTAIHCSTQCHCITGINQMTGELAAIFPKKTLIFTPCSDPLIFGYYGNCLLELQGRFLHVYFIIQSDMNGSSFTDIYILLGVKTNFLEQ